MPAGAIDCPIEQILGVFSLRREPLSEYTGDSVPGSMIHYVDKGTFSLKLAGHEYQAVPGDIIYFQKLDRFTRICDSNVCWIVMVSFDAPRLPPPPHNRRLIHASADIRQACFEMLATSEIPDSMRRGLGLFARLSAIIQFITAACDAEDVRNETEVWMTVERRIRQSGKWRPSLDELAGMANRARASIVRDCRQTTGTSPMRRIRELRMQEACRLLLNTRMSVKAISSALGYPRPHEFSREFKHYQGFPPTRLLLR